MADTKISALPAVAAELDADEFACNQAGVTKKETRAQIVSTITAAHNAHVAVTAAGVHGSSVASANDLLVHRDGTGRAFVQDILTSAGAAASPSHSFTGDPNTGLYNYAADELGIATAGAHRAHWNTSGAVILNDAAASSKMTGPGVTIQQGTKDDEAVAIQSTDVAHGMTAEADTDTYFTLLKATGVAGGVALRGYRDADGAAGGAVQLVGYLAEDADTTKTVNGRALVEVYGFIRDAGTPTQIGNTNADGNVFAVLTRRGGANVALLIVDEDADLHVLNDLVVAGVVDTIDVANHTHTGAAGMGPQIPTGGIVLNAVDNTIIRNSAGTSVIGKFNAGAGDPADIVAGVNDRVLAQAAGTLAFQPITPAMVTDRTRTFLVQGHTETPTVNNSILGWEVVDATQTTVIGHFRVPADFVSGMTVAPVVCSNNNGNLWARSHIYYEANGEDFGTHEDDTGWGAVAVTAGVAGDKTQEIQSQALSAEAIGDYVHCWWSRAGADVNDTVNAGITMFGWLVSYTADS